MNQKPNSTKNWQRSWQGKAALAATVVGVSFLLLYLCTFLPQSIGDTAGPWIIIVGLVQIFIVLRGPSDPDITSGEQRRKARLDEIRSKREG